MNLDGRPFRDLDIEKRKAYPVGLPENDEQWLALAAVALEVIGTRRAVRLGDPRLWRQAVLELSNLPLPPLNLPLPLWDAYQAQPFSGFKLCLANGSEVALPAWSQLYYCWHMQTLALHINKEVRFLDALEVVAVTPDAPPTSQITILERLRWLERSPQFLPFALRTRNGQGFLVDEPTSFQLDDAGAQLALHLGKEGMMFVPVSDIISVHLICDVVENLLGELTKRLNASPFVPFQICFLNGIRWTVMHPANLFLTREKLFLAEGKAGAAVQERVLSTNLSWVDRLEVLPQTK